MIVFCTEFPNPISDVALNPWVASRHGAAPYTFILCKQTMILTMGQRTMRHVCFLVYIVFWGGYDLYCLCCVVAGFLSIRRLFGM